MKISMMDMVTEFHEIFGHPIGHKPQLPSTEQFNRRHDWLMEEIRELLDAMLKTEDIVDFADALGDIVYIIYGYAVECGIDLDRVMDAIHTSNMTKLGVDGKPIHKKDGKIKKGPLYKPPTASIIRILHGHPSWR